MEHIVHLTSPVQRWNGNDIIAEAKKAHASKSSYVYISLAFCYVPITINEEFVVVVLRAVVTLRDKTRTCVRVCVCLRVYVVISTERVSLIHIRANLCR